TRRNFGSTKWCIVCTTKLDLTTCTSWQRNRAKPCRNLVLGLKKWIGHVRCEKTRRNFGSTKWCIVCTPKPDLTTGTSRQRNRAKPPRNLVLGLKKWIGQVRCVKTRSNFGSTKWCILCTPKPDLTTGTSRQRNHAKPPRNIVLGLKKWIGHVRCEKTRRNFGSTKWCIVCTPKPDLITGTSRQRNRMKPPRNIVWPIEVDCSCSLRKNKTQLRKHKVVHCMHPKTRSHNMYLPATESHETTQKLSFRPKEVDWACSLRKNNMQLWKHKVVHCMHPKTRSHNGYLPATESRETTQKLNFGPKEVDSACLLRKNKTKLRKHKVVHFMHPKTRSHNGYLSAMESRETTQKLSFGPKEVDWACSLRKNKTQLRKHKVVHFMHPKTRSHNLYLPATES